MDFPLLVSQAAWHRGPLRAKPGMDIRLLLVIYNPLDGSMVIDLGYGKSFTQVTGSATISIDVFKQIVNNVSLDISLKIKE